MPPKKKKGKKKGKKKDDGQLQLEDNFKRTMDEIEALKDHLATRKQLSRKANFHSDQWKTRLTEAEDTLKEQKRDQHDINADMTRQYKTMQTDMGLKIHTLETELHRTCKQLRLTEAELQEVIEEKKHITMVKDDEIMGLKLKIKSMEKEYERILQEALDSLAEKMEQAKIAWDKHSTMVQAKNKQVLLEFGLNPLDI